MKNLLTRSITGLFFGFLVVSSILVSNISFFILFFLVVLFGLWEFFHLAEKADVKPQKYVAIIIGLLFYTCNYLFARKIVDLNVFIVFIPLIFFIFIFEIYKNDKKPFSNIAFTILGVIYVAVPFSLFNYFTFSGENINDVVYNSNILLGVFVLLWIYDSGCYIFGVSFGRNRLFERISPKKSWEGLIGGSVITIFSGIMLTNYLPVLERTDWIIISIIIIIAGTYGDLTESLFKRSISIKDSGKILPGHGGILDRFDSIMMASPMIFTYLELFK